MKFAPVFVLLLTLVLAWGCSDSDGTDPTTPPTGDPTFQVTYSGNGSDGGSVPVDAMEYETGDTVTVAAVGTLLRAGYTFTEWNTASGGTGTAYAPAATFVMGNADVTLYAQWNQDGIIPDGWDPSLGSWSYLNTTSGEGLSGAVVDYCRIALDSQDNPVAVFALKTPADLEPLQQARHWNGASFEDFGGSDFTAINSVRWFDAIYDGSDNLWISTTRYADLSSNAYVYSHDGTDWSSETLISGDGYSYQTSLAVDSNGYPVVAMRVHPGATEAIGVKRWNGAAWNSYSDPVYPMALDNNTAIALIDDDPYVVFANSMQRAQVIANHDDTTWEAVGGSPVYPDNSANSFAIDQDSLGRPWIIFRQGGDVHVQYFDGEGWVALDNSSFQNVVDTSSVPQTMDLVFVDDIPVICYVSLTNPRGIHVMAWMDGAGEWVNLGGVAAVAPSGSAYPQLAVASDGRIFLGYKDGAAGGMMSIQVYTPADGS